jgi:hypothetical protein
MVGVDVEGAQQEESSGRKDAIGFTVNEFKCGTVKKPH